jgi:hypothetical protein
MLGFIVWNEREGIRDSMDRVRTHYNRRQEMTMHLINGIIQPTNRDTAAYLSKLDGIRPKDCVVFVAAKAAATSGIANPSFIGTSYIQRTQQSSHYNLRIIIYVLLYHTCGIASHYTSPSFNLCSIKLFLCQLHWQCCYLLAKCCVILFVSIDFGIDTSTIINCSSSSHPHINSHPHIYSHHHHQ